MYLAWGYSYNKYDVTADAWKQYGIEFDNPYFTPYSAEAQKPLPLWAARTYCERTGAACCITRAAERNECARRKNKVAKRNFSMKRVVLGSMMFLARLLSAAVLLAGTMANDWNVNGELSSFWNVAKYGLISVFYIFVGIAVLEIGIAVWRVFEKNE